MSLLSRLLGRVTARQNSLGVRNNNGNITLINAIGGVAMPVELRIPWNPVALIENPSPSQLLTWHGRLTPLIGRTPELAALQRWVDSSANVSLWILAGEGGIGKTRLAAEFAESLVAKKWSAGFVDLARFNDAASLTLDNRTLLLVDYPEERPDQLARLFDLLKRHTGPHKLRVALLTRSAPDVKKRLAERSATHLEYNDPWSFAEDSVQPYALFRAAFDAVRSDSLDKLPDESAFNAWLARSPLHTSALFIVAAALSARRQGAGHLELVGYDVLAQIARDEMAKIKRAAGGDAQAAIAAVDAVALATAFDGVTLATLRGLKNAAELGFAASALRQTLLSTQHAAEPTTSACNVLRLEPDLFAAAFLNEWRNARWHSDTQASVDRAFADLWAAALMAKVLPHWNRLAYDMTTRLERSRNWLDDWLCDAIQKDSVSASAFTYTLAGQSWFGLPRTPSQIGKRLVATASGDDEVALAERGRLFNNMSVDMAAMGDRVAALDAAREAARIYRRLAQADAAAYESDVAMSSNNLANRLVVSGDTAGALEAARDAVTIYRRLALADPAQHEPNLATSINTLAGALSVTGDQAGALDAAHEAVSIHRRLAHANPAAYEPHLAVSFTNNANFLSETSDLKGALDSAREAVKIYRRLIHANPATYEPKLAVSINNLANALIETGDRDGALKASRESLAIFRRLAQANPDAFAVDLGRSLYVLAGALVADGQQKLARDAATEAVTGLRPWAAQFPEAYGDLLSYAEELAAKLNEP